MLNLSQEATVMAITSNACRERFSSRRTAVLGRACVTLAVAAAALMFSNTQASTARLDAPGAFAIKDAQIVVGAGKTIAKGTVVFRNGLITDVGESAKIPGDARV